MTIRIFKIVFAVLMSVPLISTAGLIDRGNGLIYDDVKNLTWLQDSDYARTTGYTGVRLVDSFGRITNSVDPYGRMTWNQAKIWADELVFGGFSDWRLPTTNPAVSGFGITTSELGYMYFENLKNIPAYDNGVFLPGGYGLKNKGPFNMPDEPNYWTSTPRQGSYNEDAWVFLTSIGFQGATSAGNHSLFNAWAVRDGDSVAVPEPGSIALVLVGLFLLVIRRGVGSLAVGLLILSGCGDVRAKLSLQPNQDEQECLNSERLNFKDPDVLFVANLGNRDWNLSPNTYWVRYKAKNSYGAYMQGSMLCKLDSNKKWVRDVSTEYLIALSISLSLLDEDLEKLRKDRKHKGIFQHVKADDIPNESYKLASELMNQGHGSLKKYYILDLAQKKEFKSAK